MVKNELSKRQYDEDVVHVNCGPWELAYHVFSFRQVALDSLLLGPGPFNLVSICTTLVLHKRRYYPVNIWDFLD